MIQSIIHNIIQYYIEMCLARKKYVLSNPTSYQHCYSIAIGLQLLISQQSSIIFISPPCIKKKAQFFFLFSCFLLCCFESLSDITDEEKSSMASIWYNFCKSPQPKSRWSQESETQTSQGRVLERPVRLWMQIVSEQETRTSRMACYERQGSM